MLFQWVKFIFVPLVFAIGICLMGCGVAWVSIGGSNNSTKNYNYFAYIGGNNAAGSISGYSMNPTTGVLTPLSAGMPTDIAVQSEMMGSFSAPNGQGVVIDTTVCCGGGHGTFSYLVNAATGALTASANSPIAAYQYGFSLTIPNDPTHNLFYGIGNGSPLYSGLVDPTSGALTENTLATGGSPGSLAVTHSGKYVYVPDTGGGGDVKAYQVTTSTGALSLINTYVTQASGAALIAVDPQDRFLFVILQECAGNDVIYSYQINADGSLLPSGSIAGSNELCAGTFSFTIDNTGHYLYEGAGLLSIFTINQGSGALTANGTFNAGGGPILVDSTNTYLIGIGNPIKSASGVATGTPVLTGFSSPTSGSGPITANFDPTGQFIYTSDQGGNKVWGVKFNTLNGAFTAISGSNPLTAGLTLPAGIVFVKMPY